MALTLAVTFLMLPFGFVWLIMNELGIHPIEDLETEIWCRRRARRVDKTYREWLDYVEERTKKNGDYAPYRLYGTYLDWPSNNEFVKWAKMTGRWNHKRNEMKW